MAALLARHHVRSSRQVERMMLDRGDSDPVSYTTIDRILKATARTQPTPEVLRRVAELLGETMAQAFPEPDEERAPVVTIAGRRIALKALDGPPLTQREAEALLANEQLEDEESGHHRSPSRPNGPPRPAPPRKHPSR
jgi:hypothetical protein